MSARIPSEREPATAVHSDPQHPNRSNAARQENRVSAPSALVGPGLTARAMPAATGQETSRRVCYHVRCCRSCDLAPPATGPPLDHVGTTAPPSSTPASFANPSRNRTPWNSHSLARCGVAFPASGELGTRPEVSEKESDTRRSQRVEPPPTSRASSRARRTRDFAKRCPHTPKGDNRRPSIFVSTPPRRAGRRRSDGGGDDAGLETTSIVDRRAGPLRGAVVAIARRRR